MNDAFKRILALARRTGDRLIVTDPDGKEAFVLLNLDQYEELLGGPKDEPGLPPPPPPAPATPSTAEELPIPEDLPVQESVTPSPTPVSVPVREAAAGPVETPKIPSGGEGETVSPAKDEEFGEEQFYLEPVE